MDEPQPSYVGAMLSSQGNLYAALGSVAAAALLSIPFGFGIGAIPLIAFAAGEAIAAMWIPASPTFRDKVDRRHRAAARFATRARLLGEIEARAKRRGNFNQAVQTYTRIAERVASLYKLAEARPDSIGWRDVERLDDAGIEYLCMWLACLAMDDRAAAVNPREIEDRLAGLEREMRELKPGTDLRQLEKARADYLAVLERHRRMGSRRRALEAAMLSMPDQIEEIYQMIMTAPAAEGGGGRLDEAIDRLRMQEDIEADLAGDIAEVVPEMRAALQARPRRLSAVPVKQSS